MVSPVSSLREVSELYSLILMVLLSSISLSL
jgi:hypothetical protein